jgi:hypothetical protein
MPAVMLLISPESGLPTWGAGHWQEAMTAKPESSEHRLASGQHHSHDSAAYDGAET